ncbi:MAG: hypothetical protein HZA61_16910 [Candidatus Eisenbacteria bacterium]|uniref:SMP-30/Gluconolactonase/LRE-like region domain-containing protein n=1 Tax=Eiseniibacteriota bacterium TaxID=2212470 RepID=A0A933SH20_UNCEI|nr:hypothetical protein [Candidatus Eisenbacteria bacterium]
MDFVRRGTVLIGAVWCGLLLCAAPSFAEGGAGGAGGSNAAEASSWQSEWRAATAARAAGDWSGARAHLLRVRDRIGEAPGVSYALARAAARLGERDEALARLADYAKSGLTRDAITDPDFAALLGDSAFVSLVTRILENSRPVGEGVVVHTFADTNALVEDVAHDARRGRFLATSIVRGVVYEVSGRGEERVFAKSPHGTGRGFYAAAVDARRDLLWVSEAATPACEGWAEADSHRTGLVAFALADGRVVRHVELAPDGGPHLLGDLCVGPDGTVYVSDALGSGLWRLRPGAAALEALVPPGVFGGPQAPALSPDGRRLYVSDYGRGIAIVDLKTRVVSWLAYPPGIGLQGTDGLTAIPGALVAVQNGVRPLRVMRFELDAAGTRVTAQRTIESGTERLGEPTHGVVVGNDYVFLANTGWDRVGADQKMTAKPDAKPALLVRVPLNGSRPRGKE